MNRLSLFTGDATKSVFDSGICLLEIGEILREHTTNINHWCKLSHMVCKKTQQNKRYDQNIYIVFNNKQLKQVETLGVFIDDDC